MSSLLSAGTNTRKKGSGVAFDPMSKKPSIVSVRLQNAIRTADHRFRRILVRRPFPYTLYYSSEPDRIVVAACLHEKRNAEAMLNRR